MALRPGKFLEMSSHFMPVPLRLMISSFSCWDHFDCFLAGVARGCGASGGGRLLEDPRGAEAGAWAGGALRAGGSWAPPETAEAVAVETWEVVEADGEETSG